MAISQTAQEPQLIAFSGIPGSGKTTKALALLEELRGQGLRAVRVNRDDIRTQIFGESYHYGSFPDEDEAEVTSIQRKLLHHWLERRWTVISDDTNPSASIRDLRKLAAKHGAKFIEIPVIVELAVALERNRLRGEAGGRAVPEEIIRDKFEKQQNSLRSKGLI